ncbi:MAG: TetR/AcrR family transcriptional regulator [Lachnospiraceae bacterium]|nr:TetR/AcrR family transcriptional regulator [Lachnospiraceae bacterium]
MKRKTAKEILAESFMELASEKDIEKITIKDIADNCGYSTATFYRQFKDKYDLIAWNYSSQVEKNIGRIGSEGHTWKEAFLESASYNLDNKNYLLNLFKHTSGRYSFEKYMTDVNVRFITEYLKKNSAEISDDLMRVLEMYCSGTVRITIDRLDGKYDADPEAMARIYDLSMPEILRNVLEIEE